MSTDVNAAVATWNAEYATATAELPTLEATLKADYNKYVDSLAAYVARVKAANDIRQGYERILGIEDVANDTRTRKEFLALADDPIANIAENYLLDKDRNGKVTTSLVLVGSCNADELLARKAL